MLKKQRTSSYIIFLDIDGVLNQLQGNYYLDIRCIKNLATLCHKLNAQIVLTSSWRIGYLHIGSCSPQIEELKAKFARYGIVLNGRVKNLNNRTDEIKEYIDTYQIKRFLILDDDKMEFLNGILPNTYFVDGKKGLTEQDVNKIIRKYK